MIVVCTVLEFGFGLSGISSISFIAINYSKIEVPRCSKFKVRKHGKVRRKRSQHLNKCKSQMGEDQVSGGVSVLCWLAEPVVMFDGNLRNLAVRSKSVIRSSSVISSRTWCNAWSRDAWPSSPTTQFHFRFWVIDCVETFSLLEKK